ARDRPRRGAQRATPVCDGLRRLDRAAAAPWGRAWRGVVGEVAGTGVGGAETREPGRRDHPERATELPSAPRDPPRSYRTIGVSLCADASLQIIESRKVAF